MRELTIKYDTWPLDRPFTISRGSRTETQTITVELNDGVYTGRGECMPYAHYGESRDSVAAQIESIENELAEDSNHQELRTILAPGAARNAVDCALWDLQAKTANCRAWDLCGLTEPKPPNTAATISLGTPLAMGEAARAIATRPLIKVKIDDEQILERIRAVREVAPNATLILDANEAWDLDLLRRFASPLHELGVKMIEQPLPAAKDEELEHYHGPIPLCADESCHTADDLEKLQDLYQIVNVKLDKVGGLTEGFEFVRRARELNFDLMVGCMVGTSLAMAPAVLLTDGAEYVDLDGPLWLAEDREHALDFSDYKVSIPSRDLWG